MITPERVDELIEKSISRECILAPVTLRRTRIDDRTIHYEWVLSCCPFCGREHVYDAGYRQDDAAEHLGLKACPVKHNSLFVIMRDYDYKRDEEIIEERTLVSETAPKFAVRYPKSEIQEGSMITPEYVDSLIRMLEVHKCPVAPATLVRSIEGRRTVRFDWIVDPCPHCGGQHKVFAGHHIEEAHTYLGKEYCLEGGRCEKYIIMREYDVKRDAAKIARAMGVEMGGSGDGVKTSDKPCNTKTGRTAPA